MTYFKLKFEDFKRVFEFGANYYLDPSKKTSGRTTGEPRGLGAILDNFTLGKLTEIGVEKLLKEYCPNKDYILDFDIKQTSKVKDEPDIISIKENGVDRIPNIFIEIKNTSKNDRWIGPTEEQYNTMKRSAENKEIYIICASIKSNIQNKNSRTTDLAGMFLKEIENKEKSIIFQEFADLNAECKIEFIISSKDLDKYSFPFEKGMNMYETHLFEEKKRTSVYSKKGLKKNITKTTEFINYNNKIELRISKNRIAERKQLSDFAICGSFKIYYTNKKATYIECLSDVTLENNIFGKFSLKKNHFYSFVLPILYEGLGRNNLLISKRRIYQLIEDNKIKKPEIIMKKISKNI